MFQNLGMPEILVILLFILIFFGSKKIPELAQGLGKGIREFRKAAKDIQDEIENPAEPAKKPQNEIESPPAPARKISPKS